MHFIHDWKWDEKMTRIGSMWVQYARCQVCGKIKVREVLP